jgi:hypothetical protein
MGPLADWCIPEDVGEVSERKETAGYCRVEERSERGKKLLDTAE